MITTATRPNATGAPGYSETLPREEGSVRRARLLVSAALNAWGLGDEADAGALIASELVTNAVQHGEGQSLRISIRLPERGRVHIAVADKSRTEPVPREATNHDVTGRGLLLVNATANEWGTDLRHWGKVVWAELVVESNS
ncbi:ATP-binding protein [Streptomyces sp. NEAU-L66]|uniref:ATP-binding protein n=1 Tax=Streptomyces sp. NEAU-L66 TaxID=3390812 RepID=UPI0039C613F0